MANERDPALARTLWRRMDTIHAVVYFAPEPIAALKKAGYKGFWMGYFAGRAAPMGPVGPEVVTALFYNFAPSRVASALPDAWGFASPDVALAARRAGAVATLERSLGELCGAAELATAAELARRAAESAPCEGRPLAAANQALPSPGEPLADLWQATTTLREHRGDGHVAALVAAGISGREANVLQSAYGGTPRAVFEVARDYGDDEWSELVERLASRGLLTTDGEATDAGRALKADIEDRTDRAALTAYEALADDEIESLVVALKPLAAAVIASGELPQRLPTGLSLD